MSGKEFGAVPAAEGPVADDRAEFFVRHRGWLRTVVATQLREPGAVQEVLDEVALAAVSARGVPAEASRWAPWLYRVAVRSALLYRRRLGRERRRREVYAGRLAGREDPGAAYDPLRLLLADEERGLIRKAVEGLRRKDAEVLLLKYSEGWSYGEIAGRLGMTASAVEARLHRARKRLRDELAALGVIEAGR
jgi:RNA polymerase sigma factor (sigma-70 family)